MDTFKVLKEKADRSEFKVLLVQMNTPGGRIDATKEIVSLMNEFPVPIIVWVGPAGASATSAGAILGLAAHGLYMSSGTSIGASTPVSSKGNLTGDLRKKSVNDLNALVRSLAQMRSRPESVFSSMVTEAKSFSADEALKEKAIDGKAKNNLDVLSNLKGRTFELAGKKVEIPSDNDFSIQKYEKTLGQKLLDFLSHPLHSSIFFGIGLLLVLLELQAPGGFLAGTAGAFFMALGTIGMFYLPINWFGLALMGLSLIFFILEFFIVSFGLLTVAGVSSLVIGSVLLYRSPYSFISLDHKPLFIFYGFVAAMALAVGGFLFYFLKKKPAPSFVEIVGKSGSIIDIVDDSYISVRVQGEVWRAQFEGEDPRVGEPIKVLAEDKVKLLLTVARH